MIVAAQLLADSLLLGGLYMLLAIGLSLSFGVTHILNFTHGEAVMLGAYGAFWPFAWWGVDPLLSLPGVMLLGFAGGYAMFAVFVRPVLPAPRFNQILLTFGIGLMLQNLAAILWSGDVRSTNPDYALESITIGPIFLPAGRLLAFAAAAVIGTGLYLWLTRTDSGRAARAIAQNRAAATLMGINVDRTYAVVFAVGTAIAAGAGAIVSFLSSVTPFMGFPIIVKAFAVIVLGGLGSLVGTVAASFLLAAAEIFASFDLPNGASWADGVAFIVLFVVLTLRPNGLLGHGGVLHG